jgi:hypothetical protein
MASAPFSLAAQIETFSAALRRYEGASPAIQRWLKGCQLGLRRLEWFARHEAGFRAFVATFDRPAGGVDSFERAIPDVLDARNWLISFAREDGGNDGQREYLARRLDAAIDTIAWLDDNAAAVRAFASQGRQPA